MFDTIINRVSAEHKASQKLLEQFAFAAHELSSVKTEASRHNLLDSMLMTALKVADRAESDKNLVPSLVSMARVLAGSAAHVEPAVALVRKAIDLGFDNKKEIEDVLLCDVQPRLTFVEFDEDYCRIIKKIGGCGNQAGLPIVSNMAGQALYARLTYQDLDVPRRTPVTLPADVDPEDVMFITYMADSSTQAFHVASAWLERFSKAMNVPLAEKQIAETLAFIQGEPGLWGALSASPVRRNPPQGAEPTNLTP